MNTHRRARIALVKCYECKNSISDQAMTCTNCGAETISAMEARIAIMPNKFYTAIFLLNVIYMFTFFTMGSLIWIWEFSSWNSGWIYIFLQYHVKIYNYEIFPWFWVPLFSVFIITLYDRIISLFSRVGYRGYTYGFRGELLLIGWLIFGLLSGLKVY